MKLQISEQLIIVGTGFIGGILAQLVSILVFPPLPFSEEILQSISSQNIRMSIFNAGLTFMFLLSLLLGALVPALWVGFKQQISVTLASRLYSLGVLFLVTAMFADLGRFSGRHSNQWLGLYFAQVIVIFIASYGMVWLGALAARLTRHSKGTR